MKKMHPIEPEKACPFVGETLRDLRSAVGNEATVLGFVGCPYTLATYLVEVSFRLQSCIILLLVPCHLVWQRAARTGIQSFSKAAFRHHGRYTWKAELWWKKCLLRTGVHSSNVKHADVLDLVLIRPAPRPLYERSDMNDDQTVILQPSLARNTEMVDFTRCSFIVQNYVLSPNRGRHPKNTLKSRRWLSWSQTCFTRC